jgi:hypothetical protein
MPYRHRTVPGAGILYRASQGILALLEMTCLERPDATLHNMQQWNYPSFEHISTATTIEILVNFEVDQRFCIPKRI